MARGWEDEGGAAFPINESLVLAPETGMSLRDWFAGQALAVMRLDGSTPAEGVALLAYQIADAMLRERAKEQAP